MKRLIFKTICPIWLAIALLTTGCGGGTSVSNPASPQGKPIDPSGNWRMTFTDSNNQVFLLSALFNQTGSIVTAVNISEVGNPATFQCASQANISLANGTVQNINQFSGDLSGNFGSIHFTSTLNDAGTHASGTYTVTPGAGGNCLGVALTGTFTADEIPSMTGNWTGTVTCSSNCPTGVGSGNFTASLTQDDATGSVNGTFALSGIPGFTTGTIATGKFDLLSGASWQDTMKDQNGNVIAFIAGGPLNSFGTAGLATDRSFHGIISDGTSGDPVYLVSMTH
jgi:hypothetical protein